MCANRSFFSFPFLSYEVPPEVKQAYRDQYNPWSASFASQVSFSYAAAALLAVDHWNNRDTTVVPELANVEDCTVHFPDPKYADSQSDGERSVKALWEAIQNKSYQPCAVLGPLEEQATFNLQSALAALDIPLLVHYVENDRAAADASVSPVSVTMSLSALGRAKAMVQYLVSRENLNIAGVRSTLKQESMLAESIERIGEEMFDLNVAVFVDKMPAPDQDEDNYYRESLQRLKDNGITTIFLTSIRDPYRLPQFAIYLEQVPAENESGAVALWRFCYLKSPLSNRLNFSFTPFLHLLARDANDGLLLRIATLSGAATVWKRYVKQSPREALRRPCSWIAFGQTTGKCEDYNQVRIKTTVCFATFR